VRGWAEIKARKMKIEGWKMEDGRIEEMRGMEESM